MRNALCLGASGQYHAYMPIPGAAQPHASAALRCPLCQIVLGHVKTPFEYLIPGTIREDQIIASLPCAISVIDVAPIGPGHSIVITTKHRMSMGAATREELIDVQELTRQIGSRITARTGLPFVTFEHGQRNEHDNPFGCAIVHAHLHVVGTQRSATLDLDALSAITFSPYNSGILALPSKTDGKHYLYVANRAGQAWLAFPDQTLSQILRRHFLEPSAGDRELRWNWSDQVILSDSLATRRRVLENLALLKEGC
jgi:diadenosine tetraphosphate (Ap4A) HIT family hydrolase